MAFVLNDRVEETSTTLGTANFELDGATEGHRTFVDGIGDTNTTFYLALDTATGQWERGIGTVNDLPTPVLERTTVKFNSSGTTSKINFGAGTRRIFVDVPSESFPHLDKDGNPVNFPNIAGMLPPTPVTIAAGQIVVTGDHVVDTEASAAEDDVTHLDLTAINEGGTFQFTAADQNRAPIFKHKSGVPTEMDNVDGQDFALRGLTHKIVYQKLGGVAVEQARSPSGSQDAVRLLDDTNHDIEVGDFARHLLATTGATEKTFKLPPYASVWKGWWTTISQINGTLNLIVAAQVGEKVAGEDNIKLTWNDLGAGAASVRGDFAGSVIIIYDGTTYRAAFRTLVPASKKKMEQAVRDDLAATPDTLRHHPDLPTKSARFHWTGAEVNTHKLNKISIVTKEVAAGTWRADYDGNMKDTNYDVVVFAASSGDTMGGSYLTLTKAVDHVIFQTRKATNGDLVNPDILVRLEIYGEEADP